YAPASNTLRFAPGETTQIARVRVLGDLLNEANEAFAVNLANSSNATIGTGAAVGTIINDDAVPTVSIGNARLLEGNVDDKGNSTKSDMVFKVQLSAPSGQAIKVNYETEDQTARA